MCVPQLSKYSRGLAEDMFSQTLGEDFRLYGIQEQQEQGIQYQTKQSNWKIKLKITTPIRNHEETARQSE